jgi:enoyl-CoA hydratase/carnithine racemase
MACVELTREAEIGIVTLNRPRRLNAISTELTRVLHEVLFEAMHDDAIRVIVLTGAGRAFCAGDDLKEFDLQSADRAAIVRHIDGIQRITRDLMFARKLVVGAVHGYAVGGGFEWMLNCDLIVASEDLVAFFPEMEWGQFVTGGVSHLLPQAVGYQQAMELLVLGERQSAARLRERGLVNQVVPLEQLMDRALEVARAAAARSPASVAALKQLMTRGLRGDLDRALELEQAITIERFESEEAAQRVKGFTTRR